MAQSNRREIDSPSASRNAPWRDLRLRSYQGKIPSVAPVARAAMSDDAPAVGAAILPFSERFLPTRFALMNNVGDD